MSSIVLTPQCGYCVDANEAEYYHKFAQRLQQLITTPYSSEPVGIRKHRPHIDQTLAQFFDKFPRTPKNYNKFIYSLADQGKVEEAMEALQDMKDTETPRSVEVYTTLAKTFITTKDPDGALKLIEDMKLGSQLAGLASAPYPSHHFHYLNHIRRRWCSAERMDI
jgi:pentatricopeptide repeat protein